MTALVQEGVGSVAGTDGSRSEKEDSGMGLGEEKLNRGDMKSCNCLMAMRTMGRFQEDVGHNLILIYKIMTWANTLKNGLCEARETRC